MKKLWFLLLLLVFGCAGLDNGNLTSRIDALEQEVNRLKIMGLAGEAAATDRIWPFYGLSSGTNALNGISEANIGAKDMALGRDSNGYTYVFYWDATDDNTTGCTSPSCIEPSDQVDNTGSWLTTAQFYVDAFVSSAADGEHFIDPSNSSAFPTGIAEGSITCRDDRDACFVYDGTDWLPMRISGYGEYSATGTIENYHAWGGFVNNNGVPAATNITLTLPSAVKYMLVTISRVDADGSITIQENSGDNILSQSDIVLDANNESVTLFAINTSTWVVVSDANAPTYN
jgi:hypothetical protein